MMEENIKTTLKRADKQFLMWDDNTLINLFLTLHNWSLNDDQQHDLHMTYDLCSLSWKTMIKAFSKDF